MPFQANWRVFFFPGVELNCSHLWVPGAFLWWKGVKGDQKNQLLPGAEDFLFIFRMGGSKKIRLGTEPQPPVGWLCLWVFISLSLPLNQSWSVAVSVWSRDHMTLWSLLWPRTCYSKVSLITIYHSSCCCCLVWSETQSRRVRDRRTQ